MKKKDEKIWFEMARRKVQFHRDKIWNKIELWGLFHWGEVSHLLKTGELETSMKKLKNNLIMENLRIVREYFKTTHGKCINC